MRLKLVLLASLAIGLQWSCKTEKEPETILEYDQITHQAINKSLHGPSLDSLAIACYPTFVAIERNPDTTSSDSLLVFVKYPTQIPNGDCGIQYFTGTSDNSLKCLLKNNVISQYSQWNSPLAYSFSMEDFKGRGQRYIGFRKFAPPYPYLSDMTHYAYGWLCVELTANGDSLKIIDMACNETKAKSILTGQIK